MCITGSEQAKQKLLHSLRATQEPFYESEQGRCLPEPVALLDDDIGHNNADHHKAARNEECPVHLSKAEVLRGEQILARRVRAQGVIFERVQKLPLGGDGVIEVDAAVGSKSPVKVISTVPGSASPLFRTKLTPCSEGVKVRAVSTGAEVFLMLLPTKRRL